MTLGTYEVIGKGSYIVGTNRPAEDIVHGHHLIEWLSQRGVQAGSLVLLDAAWASCKHWRSLLVGATSSAESFC